MGTGWKLSLWKSSKKEPFPRSGKGSFLFVSAGDHHTPGDRQAAGREPFILIDFVSLPKTGFSAKVPTLGTWSASVPVPVRREPFAASDNRLLPHGLY